MAQINSSLDLRRGDMPLNQNEVHSTSPEEESPSPPEKEVLTFGLGYGDFCFCRAIDRAWDGQRLPLHPLEGSNLATLSATASFEW